VSAVLPDSPSLYLTGIPYEGYSVFSRPQLNFRVAVTSDVQDTEERATAPY